MEAGVELHLDGLHSAAAAEAIKPTRFILPTAGDTIFPVPSGGVSFMYSFPNLLPLPADQVGATWDSSLRQESLARLALLKAAQCAAMPIHRARRVVVQACPILVESLADDFCSRPQIARIGRRLEGCAFDRLYGAFAHTRITAGAAQQVQQSVRKYCGLLDGSVQRVYI